MKITTLIRKLAGLLPVVAMLCFAQTARAQLKTPKLNSVQLPFAIDGYVERQTDSMADWTRNTYTNGFDSGALLYDFGGGKPAISAAYLLSHKRDIYTNTNTDDVFDGGNKWNDNPEDWGWKFKNCTPAKDDVSNCAIHFTEDTAGDMWAIMFADRETTTGTSYIDFEFFQNTVTAVQPAGSTPGTFSSAGPKCGRTEGDILITVEYTNGGRIDSFYYYKWDSVGGSGCGWDWSQFYPATKGLGYTNSGTVDVPFGGFGSSTYSNLQFAEIAINMTAVTTLSDSVEIDPCTGLGFATLIVKTKSSNAYTADLKDLIEPFQLNIVVGVADISYGGPYCPSGQTVTPTNNGPNITKGGKFKFFGSNAGGVTIDSMTGKVTISENAKGQYGVIYYYEPRPNCFKQDTAYFTVNGVKASVIAGAQTVCTAGDPSAFTVNTAATGSGTLTYQWQSAATCNGTFSNIGGATNSTYDVPSGITSTTAYRVIVTSSITGLNCFDTSNCVTVTVQSINPGSIAANQAICEGDDPAAFTSTQGASGDGTITYLWQYSDDSSSWNNIAGETNATYDAGALTADRWYRRMATGNLNGNLCARATDPVKVSVNNMTPGVIAANQNICEGDDPAAFTVTTAATGDGVITYQWQVSSTSAVAGFADIGGATDATYDPAAITADRWYKRLATSTLLGKACTEESNVLKITVNNMQPGTIAANQNICEGDDVAAFTNTGSATGDGTITYLWQYSDNNSTWNDIAGATNATYDAGTITQDRWYRRQATSTLTADGNTKACTEWSNVLKVTVNNLDPGTIAANQNICEGDDVAAFTSTSNGSSDGALTYLWQYSDNNSTWNDIAGATNATYDAGTITQDRWYRRQATSTLSADGNIKACTEWSNVLKVTVNNLDPGAIGGSATICEGNDVAAFTNTTSGTGDGNITYQWQVSTTSGVAGFSDIPGATNATYDHGTITQDHWFRRLATSTFTDNGNTRACTESSNVLEVTVNNITPGTIGYDQEICAGEDPNTFVSISGAIGDGTVTYQWILSPDGTTWTAIPTATNDVYDEGILFNTNYYERVAKSMLNSVGCYDTTANQLVILVNQPPTVTMASFPDTFCNDIGADHKLVEGSPSGGVYVGEGVYYSNGDYYFSPTSLEPGTYLIKYHYTDSNGCKDSADQMAEVHVCGSTYCTVSQGFWGQDKAKGKFCYYDDTTVTMMRAKNMISRLLDGNPLVIGEVASVCTGNSRIRGFTITQCDSHNLTRVMPAGGASKAILKINGYNCGTGGTAGLMSYFKSCTDSTIKEPISTMHKDGRIANTLIGQTITMSLNVRNNPKLGTLPIGGNYMYTAQSLDCDSGRNIGWSSTIEYALPPSIINYLDSGYTVNELIELANKALSGSYTPGNGDPSLSDITNALATFVDAFHGCRILYGFSNTSNSSSTWRNTEEEYETEDEVSPEKQAFHMWPNPATSVVSFDLHHFVGQSGNIVVHNQVGAEILNVNIAKIGAENYLLDLNTEGIAEGIYYVTFTTDGNRYTRKLFVTQE